MTPLDKRTVERRYATRPDWQRLGAASRLGSARASMAEQEALCRLLKRREAEVHRLQRRFKLAFAVLEAFPEVVLLCRGQMIELHEPLGIDMCHGFTLVLSGHSNL
jgi:hypothetical protein